MKNKIKKFVVITISSVLFGMTLSYLLNNFIYSKLVEERSAQAITLEELINMRVEALNMCVQLSYGVDTNLVECSNMKDKIVEDVYSKLDEMPYTKFFYKYLDSKNTLDSIDRIKDIDIFPHLDKDKSK